MNKIYKLFIIAVISSVIFYSCGETDTIVTNATNPVSPLASTYDAKFATDWLWVATRIVADESRDNPPQAGRVYSYSLIALYECSVNGMPLNRSLSGQLKDMPPMPVSYPIYEYDWPTVITGAMPIMLRGLFRLLYTPAQNMINNMAAKQLQQRYALKDSAVISRSLLYGESIANRILEWANQDGFYRIKGVPYNPPSTSEHPWNWEPINPGDTAVEPYWGTLRTLGVTSVSHNLLPPSYLFDTIVGSAFYNDQIEIKNIRSNPTQEQRDIALFWRDKQLTPQPPGHWVSIMNQVILRDNMSLDRASEVFGYLGIALGDAFISCWYAKYYYNYLRPQSYIRRFIEPGWTPLVPTPPFPDYPSGHSTSSGTCSYLMTKLLGTVSFTDTTHLRIGMAPRMFNTFHEAAVECSNSRIYGGIHYRNACENGVLMGERIGADIYSRVKLKKIQ